MKMSTLVTRTLLLVPASASLFWLAGCGLGTSTGTSPRTPIVGGPLAVQGKLFGGQQPIGGATIRMYAVGATGYGSPAVSVMNSGVTVTTATDGSGSFVLTGKYTCSPEQRVYLTATGGDAGSGPNPAIGLMAALGRCGDLTASTFISMNEVSTVASVWALAPFMSGPANIGAPATNISGLNNAMSDVAALSNLSTGTAGGSSLPAGTVMPIAAINSLADILAACINSDGGAGSTCPTLFSATTVSGVVPADTISAALSIAQHPGQNVSTLFGLITPSAPFQPHLPEAPAAFTLAATYSNPSLSSPAAVAIDSTGGAWVADTSGKVLALHHDGSAAATVSGLSSPSGVVVHQNGTVWVTNAGNATLSQISANGSLLQTVTTGGLNAPRSLAIDGQGNLWVVNGNATLSEFTGSGTALTGAGVSVSGNPVGIAMNPR